MLPASGVVQPGAGKSSGRQPLATGSATKRLLSSRVDLDQHGLAAGLRRIGHRLFERRRRAVTSFELTDGDDVAGLDAAIGGIAVGIDIGDHEALAVVGAGDGQAEIG